MGIAMKFVAFVFSKSAQNCSKVARYLDGSCSAPLYNGPSIIHILACCLFKIRSGCSIKVRIVNTSVCSIRVFHQSSVYKCTCFTDLRNSVFWTQIWITEGLLYCTQIMCTRPVKNQLEQWNMESNLHFKKFCLCMFY